ncbi:MAG TPA: sialidase family protein [Myxococcota bacterium]|nr:sialidase family protein [Myxococcota bacterium]
MAGPAGGPSPLGAVLARTGAALAGGLARAWPAVNHSEVDPRLELESWDVVADGRHNSNTDMILWRDELLLVHDARPYHLGTPESRLVVRRSKDGRDWETLASLAVAGKDIRDPKLAVIGGRLHLYALPNSGTYAVPESTVLATSDDAVHWTPFEPVEPRGWLFWRPKTRDGVTWYVSAYWHRHGESILLRSTDGRSWTTVSTIHRGDANDETEIEFLGDGRLLATARLEMAADTLVGHADACTAIAVSEPPYQTWTEHRSQVTRLDGPVLFSHGGTVYAVARYQPGARGPLTQLGSALAHKRTSIFRVEPERLVRLSDLPSAGDTSYAGAVLRDGSLWVDYYTSRIDRDYPWLLGMFLPSDIRMARIPLRALAALSTATP